MGWGRYGGGHAAATVITHPSWKSYTGNSHSHKGAVTRSGNNTHSVQYVFKTPWIWQLIIQLLCKKTLRYFITIIICIRRGKRTHTHTHVLLQHFKWYLQWFPGSSGGSGYSATRRFFPKEKTEKHIIQSSFTTPHSYYVLSCLCTQELSVSSSSDWHHLTDHLVLASSQDRSILTPALLLQLAILAIEAVSLLAPASMAFPSLRSDVKEFIYSGVESLWTLLEADVWPQKFEIISRNTVKTVSQTD